MATTLIGPDTKVEQTWAGSDWKPDDVAAAVKAAELRTIR
jgi:hypothetical protein